MGVLDDGCWSNITMVVTFTEELINIVLLALVLTTICRAYTII